MSDRVCSESTPVMRVARNRCDGFTSEFSVTNWNASKSMARIFSAKLALLETLPMSQGAYFVVSPWQKATYQNQWRRSSHQKVSHHWDLSIGVSIARWTPSRVRLQTFESSPSNQNPGSGCVHKSSTLKCVDKSIRNPLIFFCLNLTTGHGENVTFHGTEIFLWPLSSY